MLEQKYVNDNTALAAMYIRAALSSSVTADGAGRWFGMPLTEGFFWVVLDEVWQARKWVLDLDVHVKRRLASVEVASVALFSLFLEADNAKPESVRLGLFEDRAFTAEVVSKQLAGWLALMREAREPRTISRRARADDDQVLVSRAATGMSRRRSRFDPLTINPAVVINQPPVITLNVTPVFNINLAPNNAGVAQPVGQAFSASCSGPMPPPNSNMPRAELAPTVPPTTQAPKRRVREREVDEESDELSEQISEAYSTNSDWMEEAEEEEDDGGIWDAEFGD